MSIKSLKIKNNIKNVFTFITLLFFISSCTSSNTIPSTNLESNTSCALPEKNFSIKSAQLDKKPNQGFRIKVLKKNFSQPLEIKTVVKFPIAETIEHQGVKIIPAVIKNVHHKALSLQEVKKQKKALWKELRDKLRAKYKIERMSLRSKQKEERITNRQSYLDLLKVYKKGSPERQEYIDEQIQLREEIINEQLDDRIELKKQYKSEVEELKKLLNPKYQTKSFSTKNDPDCEFDPTCNPFDYANYEGVHDDSTDYDYFDSDNSYSYDSTFVDGQPYNDSTQETQPEITNTDSDYGFGDTVDQVLKKHQFNISSCFFEDVEVQKKGTNLSFNVKGVSQTCDLDSFTFSIKSKEDPASCGQTSESSVTYTRPETHSPIDDLKTVIDIFSLRDNIAQDVIMTVKKTSGQSESFNLGTLNPEQEKEVKFDDVDITNEYTLEKLRAGLNGSNQITLNYLINKYRFTISNKHSDSKFSFVIKDDSGKDVNGFFDEQDMGKTILGSECKNYTNPPSPDGKTGLIFEIDRAKFETGKYHIFLLDSKNRVVRDSQGKIRHKGSFFISNLSASTYATNLAVAENSEEAQVPSDGAFFPRQIITPSIDTQEKELMDVEINNATSTINNSNDSCQSSFIKSTLDKNAPNTYQKYVSSQIIKGEPNKQFEKFNTFSTQACKKIIVGASIDLTNTNRDLNEKIFKQGRDILLSLELEDNNCKLIDRYFFVARVGTKHIVNHVFNSLKDYGKSCKDDVVFVKVKKALLMDEVSKFQRDYIIGLNRIENPQADGQQAKNIFDYFAYVNNSMSTDTEGTKIRLSKCDNSDIPCNPLDYTKGKEKVNTLIQNVNNLTLNNEKAFKLKDSVDLYPINYDFKLEANLQELINSILSYNPFSTQGDNDKFTIPSLDQLAVDSLNNKEEPLFDGMKIKRNNIITDVRNLQYLFNTQYPDPKMISERLNTLSKNSINLSKEITNSSIEYSGKKVTAVSSPRIANILIDTLLMTKDILDVATTLNNLNAQAKDGYSNAIDKAVNVIRKSHSSECLKYASKALLSRVRNYMATYVVDPLQTIVLQIDQKSIWSIKESDLTSLSLASISSLPLTGIAQNQLDKECKEKDDGCSVIDFNNQGSKDYVSDKVIKCRVKYKLVSGRLEERNFIEKNKLVSNLDIINGLRLDTESTTRKKATEKSNSIRVFGFIKVYQKPITTGQYIYLVKGVSGSTQFADELDFAPIPSGKRLFNDLIILPNPGSNVPDPTNDTEVRMFEFLAKKYPETEINADEFTDREPCTSCQNVMSGVESIKSNIHILKPLLFGIYTSGELIPTPRSRNYYSNLID